AQLRGSAERCLILGVGVLDGLRIGAFKAVLAHEYGHFSNRDTAGGGLALAVRRSLIAMARALGESGAASWWNPAWIFLNVFFRVFLRISQGASRLQEILADRWAAFTYGSKAFEEGLRHVIEQSVRFEARAGGDAQRDRDVARRAREPLPALPGRAPAHAPAHEGRDRGAPPRPVRVRQPSLADRAHALGPRPERPRLRGLGRGRRRGLVVVRQPPGHRGTDDGQGAGHGVRVAGDPD